MSNEKRKIAETKSELDDALSVEVEQRIKRQKTTSKKRPKLKSAPKEIERALIEEGYQYIIGVDETGVGSIAGPLCVCAVHVPLEVDIEGVRDSKSFASDSLKIRRDEIYDQLNQDPRVKKQIVFLDHNYVDKHNPLKTRMDGMAMSVEQLIVAEKVLERYKLEDIVVLIDGNCGPKQLTEKYQCRLIVKGDVNCYAIGAASIFAKIVRDRYMTKLHAHFPEYGWDVNHGYPCSDHMQTVRAIGNSNFHRVSFNPCKTRDYSVKAKEWMTKHKTTDAAFHYGEYETMPSSYKPNETKDVVREVNKVNELNNWW